VDCNFELNFYHLPLFSYYLFSLNFYFLVVSNIHNMGIITRVFFLTLIQYSATSFSVYFLEFCSCLFTDMILFFVFILKVCFILFLYTVWLSSDFSCTYPEGSSEMEVLCPLKYSHFCKLRQKH
jgi:hypothetical protein